MRRKKEKAVSRIVVRETNFQRSSSGAALDITPLLREELGGEWAVYYFDVPPGTRVGCLENIADGTVTYHQVLFSEKLSEEEDAG